MLKPFHQFMEKIIDYAGLFPPAELPMNQAIHNYAKYRKESEAWMLSRFICPAGRLGELKAYQDNIFSEGERFEFSVLSGGGKDANEFLARLGKDISAIGTFLDALGERVGVEVLEARLPLSVLRQANPQLLAKFLNTAATLWEKKSPAEIMPFYEAAFAENWRTVIQAVVQGLVSHNRYIEGTGQFKRYRLAGFKLRCGGVEPNMYPTPEQVAFTIALCRENKIPMKMTAGLHHPVRHFNQSAGVKMHGFLNVFGAAILAEAHSLERQQIQEIIEDEEAGNFLFTRRAFAWKNLRASVDEITHARQHNAISFGSCSFDEPREDLQKLKLL